MSDDVTRVEKPWGYELHWAKTERYVGKLIHVNAGHALSLQYHNLKDETIYLHSGRLLFEIQEGDELVKREMLPGERVHITPKTDPPDDGDRRQRHLRGLDAGTARRGPARRPLRTGRREAEWRLATWTLATQSHSQSPIAIRDPRTGYRRRSAARTGRSAPT